MIWHAGSWGITAGLFCLSLCLVYMQREQGNLRCLLAGLGSMWTDGKNVLLKLWYLCGRRFGSKATWCSEIDLTAVFPKERCVFFDYDTMRSGLWCTQWFLSFLVSPFSAQTRDLVPAFALWRWRGTSLSEEVLVNCRGFWKGWFRVNVEMAQEIPLR